MRSARLWIVLVIKLERPVCPNVAALNGGNYKHPDNKAALVSASHEKCMYCESKFRHIDYGDVEHYKPKAKYPQFEFDWQNLGIACVTCNREYKKDKFDEANPYVNPYADNPDDHIVAHGPLLIHKQGSERGQVTIEDIGLNRPALLEKRGVRQVEIVTAIDSCMRTNSESLKKKAFEELLKLHQADQEYSSIAKSIFQLQGILEK